MVSRKVPNAIPASTREIFHSAAKVRGFNSPRMAVMTTAASTDCGTWYISGISHSSAIATKTTLKRVAQPVWAVVSSSDSIQSSASSRPCGLSAATHATVVAQMAEQHGALFDAMTLRSFHNAYVEHLLREIHEPGPRKGVLPGVREVLEALHGHKDAHLSLLTGNFERGAQIKLEYFDLWRFFRSGAFGDASSDRNSLLGAALARIRREGGPDIDPSNVVVVGDTPLDVAVAVAGGARSLAVATGSYDSKALAASGADVVLQDLSDVKGVLDAMGFSTGPG